MKSSAKTPQEFLDSLPPERRQVIAAVRKVIRDHLPEGYREMMDWGGLVYAIPLEVYPDTYNKAPLCYAALTAQKNYCSLYLMRTYGDAKAERWLRDRFTKAGKTLDMGKACIRFKSVDDLDLDAVGTLVAGTTPEEWIAIYEASRAKKTHAPRMKSSGR